LLFVNFLFLIAVIATIMPCRILLLNYVFMAVLFMFYMLYFDFLTDLYLLNVTN